MTALKTPIVLDAKGDASLAELVSGYGKYHSEKHPTNPRKYLGVSVPQILKMLERPQSVEKSQAQWFIPSTLKSRDLKEQLEKGQFHSLWAETDTPNRSAREMTQALENEIAPSLLCSYTTKSATKESQKCRFLIPLCRPVSGSTFVLLQRIFNNKLSEAGIEPDDSNERANQPCYLPNLGEFYQSYIGTGKPLDPDEWRVELEAQEKALKEEQARLERLKAEAITKGRKLIEQGMTSPIEALKNAFELEVQAKMYGYLKKGGSGKYISPLSQSGEAGFKIVGERWLSMHASESEMGQPAKLGRQGDKFDLFAFHEHGNDRNAALKAAGEMFTINGRTITKANQIAYMERKAKEEAEKGVSKSEQAGNEPPIEQAGNEPPIEFDPPIDLFDSLEVPPFPVDLMPKTIRDYAKDQSELIGVDPAIIAITALGAAAACIDDRIRIQPKRHDPTWTESARLWVATIGEPSAMKSPGIKKAIRPLNKIDQDWRKVSELERKKWEERKKKAEQELKNGEGEPFKEPEPPLKRLIINDATVESMGQILSKMEPRGILSFMDELDGWFGSHDAYRNGGSKDRPAWLEAYNGGSRAIDRIQRGQTYVENWSACVIGGIQPSVIQKYTNNSNHDGLLQRFTLVYARPAEIGQDRKPDMQAIQNYEWLMDHLAKLGVPNGQPVKLSEDAHKVREQLQARLHKYITGHDNKYLSAALGKWNGLFARLLLVFHSVEMAERHEYPTAAQVSGQTAQSVSDLMMKVLLSHAIKFYSGLDPAEDNARVIASLILARGWLRFTVKRDLNQNSQQFKKLKPWEQDSALERLEALGWIVPQPWKLNEKGKPVAYLVNPEVHQRFKDKAENERSRRAEVAAMIEEQKRASRKLL